MNKYILLLVALFGSGCEDVTSLEYYCKNQVSCYLPEGFENIEKNIIFGDEIEDYGDRVDYCALGKTVCEDEQIRCEGVTYPQLEECDGLDNDCNGVIDDPEMFHAPAYNTKCYFEEIGACRASHQECFNGELICLHQTSPYYGPEVCDNMDNDCDGLYDEDVPSEFIYEGPLETVNVGECRAGITECVDGAMTVRGMVIPQGEICGNGKDDDCDHLVDEEELNFSPVDYALLIDFSGSMYPFRIVDVISTICYSPTNPYFLLNRYALVGIAVSGGNDPEYSLDLVTDFTDLPTVCSILASEATTEMFFASSGRENQLDAIIRIFDPSTPIALSWAEGNEREVYVFSDEETQGFPLEETDAKIAFLAQHCVENDYEIGLFADLNFITPGWGDIDPLCMRFIENLNNLSDESYLQAYLLSWFGQSC